MIGTIKVSHQGYEYGSNRGWSRTEEFSQYNFRRAKKLMPWGIFQKIMRERSLSLDGDCFKPLIKFMAKSKQGEIKRSEDRMKVEIKWEDKSLGDSANLSTLYKIDQLKEKEKETALILQKGLERVEKNGGGVVAVPSSEKITKFTSKRGNLYYKLCWEAQGMNNSTSVPTFEVWTKTHWSHSLRCVNS